MSNMSYCRFENTLADLRDCWEHMDDIPQSASELQARKRMIELCKRIADDYADNE